MFIRKESVYTKLVYRMENKLNKISQSDKIKLFNQVYEENRTVIEMYRDIHFRLINLVIDPLNKK